MVVWADGDTRFHGAISATGGAAAATAASSKCRVNNSSVSIGASIRRHRNGAIGTLLLDPNDLYIAAAPVGGALPDTTNPFQSNNGVNDFYVLGSTLTALPVNNAIQLQANRDIIFQTSLAMPTTTGSLTFNALNTDPDEWLRSVDRGRRGFDDRCQRHFESRHDQPRCGTLTLNSSGAITQNLAIRSRVPAR